jgi:hypothetical protein
MPPRPLVVIRWSRSIESQYIPAADIRFTGATSRSHHGAERVSSLPFIIILSFFRPIAPGVSRRLFIFRTRPGLGPPVVSRAVAGSHRSPLRSTVGESRTVHVYDGMSRTVIVSHTGVSSAVNASHDRCPLFRQLSHDRYGSHSLRIAR